MYTEIYKFIIYLFTNTEKKKYVTPKNREKGKPIETEYPELGQVNDLSFFSARKKK